MTDKLMAPHSVRAIISRFEHGSSGHQPEEIIDAIRILAVQLKSTTDCYEALQIDHARLRVEFERLVRAQAAK